MNHLSLVWLKKMITHHSSLITQFSSLITHHSSLKILQLPTPHLFGTITHLSSLNIFQLFVGLIPITWCSFYFFFFFLRLPIPKLTEPNEEKKKKKTHRTQWGKKKESKVAVDLTSGSLNACLITEMPLKTELWKLKTHKMCFQFP